MSAATSAPNADQHRQRQLDPKLGLYFAIADQLIPFFYPGAGDPDLARAMARSAVQAYEPETRADFANIARIIAFSMAALSLLGQAAEEPMTMAEKMRAYGRANALNRSADLSERTMIQRRRRQQAQAEPEPPPPPKPDMNDAEVEAAVAQAIRQAMNLTKTDAAARPNAIKPAAQAPVIRYDTPTPTTTQSRTASHKDQLLHHTAIQRLTEPTGHPHPA